MYPVLFFIACEQSLNTFISGGNILNTMYVIINDIEAIASLLKIYFLMDIPVSDIISAV